MTSSVGNGSGGTVSAGLTSLPVDIIGHIHALMPMRDAARAACISRGFLRSWRCYPRLDFDMDTLGFLKLEDPFFDDDDPTRIEEVSPIIEDQIRRGIITTVEEYFKMNNPLIREFAARVDHIMQHHSGTGLKTFRVDRPPHGFYISPAIIDRWVRAAITLRTITAFELLLDMGVDIEEDLEIVGRYYSFPCSLLTSKTITSFSLAGCILNSVHTAGCLPSLTRLRLQNVRVTSEELGRFLSSTCPALEKLEISVCDDMVSLKVPRLLSRLKLLRVRSCGCSLVLSRLKLLRVRTSPPLTPQNINNSCLQMVDCDAPKLKSFGYVGTPTIHVSLGPSVREMQMTCGMDDGPAGGMLFYATTKLPSIVPNLRSLYLASCFEVADTPMSLDKFRRLKSLEIHLDRPTRCSDYDFYSLVSFLDASPALDTFILRMPDASMPESIPYGDSTTHKRQCHCKLKKVVISGFYLAKGMVELTSCILENAASLKHLILDTTYACDRKHCKTGGCLPFTVAGLLEARKAVDVIRRYIKGKVPSSVKFDVIEPCIKCHTDAACRPIG